MLRYHFMIEWGPYWSWLPCTVAQTDRFRYDQWKLGLSCITIRRPNFYDQQERDFGFPIFPDLINEIPHVLQDSGPRGAQYHKETVWAGTFSSDLINVTCINMISSRRILYSVLFQILVVINFWSEDKIENNPWLYEMTIHSLNEV